MLALVYPTVISLVLTPAPQTTSSGCSRRAALATGLATSLAALPAPSLASGEDTAGNFMKEGSQTGGASSPSTKIGASGLKDTLYGIALGDSPSGDVIDLMWFADAKTGEHQLLRPPCPDPSTIPPSCRCHGLHICAHVGELQPVQRPLRLLCGVHQLLLVPDHTIAITSTRHQPHSYTRADCTSQAR